MMLYHGSYLEIARPDLKHSRINVDFGKGFYTSPIYEQANMQVCIRSEYVLHKYLHFEGSEII